MTGFFYRQVILCTVILSFALSLGGCGRKDENAVDKLRVVLQLPAGERSELFWYAVETKSLGAWREGSLLKEWSWSDGDELDVNLDKLDELRFRAYDRLGRLLVEGSAVLGEEKKVSIPLRRVL